MMVNSRLLLPLFSTLCLLAAPVVAQSNGVRSYHWGSREVVSRPTQSQTPMRTLKVINGTVPIYDLRGNPINGTRVLYVFVDQYGRQKGGAGIGFKAADHRVGVNTFDGYIEASQVRKFAVAQTGRSTDGTVNAFRPGGKKAAYALQARRTYSSPGTGTSYSAPVSLSYPSATRRSRHVTVHRSTRYASPATVVHRSVSYPTRVHTPTRYSTQRYSTPAYAGPRYSAPRYSTYRSW